jgi:N-acetylneuraminic acid mutarotase
MTTGQGGTYGTLGTAAPGNVPGARAGALAWTDPAGNFWLFGGEGYDSNTTLGSLNDLWKFSGGQWTWMSGANTDEAVGSYGILGVAAPSNVPGARGGSTTWTDASGSLWLFGGSGNGSTSSFTESLGDVWKYSAGQWTWMGGSNAVYQPGIYESLGMPGDPGGRDSAASWTDNAGNLWIFGGSDFGRSVQPTYIFNNLWKYTP